MSVLDHPIITERYFFPRDETLDRPRYVDVDGARLACHDHRAGHPLVVVHFHGNGEVCADYVPHLPQLWSAHGADCFLAEYRGYGGSTGTPQLRKMLDDIPAIFDAVGRPAAEIVVFGRSVGSIYAIEFARRYPVAGLVLESGISDPGERVLMRARPEELGTTSTLLDAEFHAYFDHRAKLAGRNLPTLVMHAQHDSLVNASHATRLASYPESNVRLVLFDKGDHNSIFAANETAYIAEVSRLIGLCRDDEAYDDRERPHVNDTIEGGIAVFESTREYDSPVVRRTGPGQTAPFTVPAVLAKRRFGPGDTSEDDAYTGPEEE